ncbi:MAG: hypothetical protein AAFP17_16825 [Pseudomonadota bacterium]
MRLLAVALIAGLVSGHALAISLDATHLDDPVLENPKPLAVLPETAALAETGTLGRIAAAGAPEFPIPTSLLLFAAGLAGVIAVHRRPLR